MKFRDRRRMVVAGSCTALIVSLTVAIPAMAASETSPPAAGMNCGATERVSVSALGTDAIGISSSSPVLSADGRFVAFTSTAKNIAAGGIDVINGVYVRDRATATTETISTRIVPEKGSQAISTETEAPSISADGRYVGFMRLEPRPDLVGARQVYVHDRVKSTEELISVGRDGEEGNGISQDIALSADGRYAAFLSNASNLVEDDTNNLYDLFLRDRVTGITERISVYSDGTQVMDGETRLTSDPTLSADGRYTAFRTGSALDPDDTNGFNDVYVYDRVTKRNELVSISSDGQQGNGNSFPGSQARGTISADGNLVLFVSDASNLIPDDTSDESDVFVHDRRNGVTERISVSTDGSEAGGFETASMSADGRYVAFMSQFPNLTPEYVPSNEWEVYVRDRKASTTRRVSVGPACAQSNKNTVRFLNDTAVSISADGRAVGFVSRASNLVSDDNNGALYDNFGIDPGTAVDIFLHTLPELTVARPPNFGPVMVGQSRALTVPIVNTSPDEVSISAISEVDAPFVSGVHSCAPPPFSLAPGERCDLNFGFSPNGTGEAEATIRLTTKAPLRPASPQFVTLSGRGVSDRIHVAPRLIDYGDEKIGDRSKRRMITVTNARDVASLVLVSSPTGAFMREGGSCPHGPIELGPFDGCTLGYSFAPSSEGRFATSLSVESEALASPVRVDLKGQGVAKLMARITAPEDGGTVSQSGTPALSVSGTATFDPALPSESTFYLDGTGCTGEYLTTEPTGDGTPKCAKVETITPLNELSATKLRYGFFTATGDVGVPLTLDTGRPLSGVVALSSVAWAGGVGIGAGLTSVDIEVEGHQAGQPSDAERVKLGTTSVSYMATPVEPVWKAPWSVELADGLDRVTFDKIFLILTIRGMNAGHGTPKPIDTTLTVPSYAASPDRYVEIVVDEGQFSSVPVEFAEHRGEWSTTMNTPAPGEHVIRVRARQGWEVTRHGETVPRYSQVQAHTIHVTE